MDCNDRGDFPQKLLIRWSRVCSSSETYRILFMIKGVTGSLLDCLLSNRGRHRCVVRLTVSELETGVWLMVDDELVL